MSFGHTVCCWFPDFSFTGNTICSKARTDLAIDLKLQFTMFSFNDSDVSVKRVQVQQLHRSIINCKTN